MARLGRGQPNRPVVRRSSLTDPSGSASVTGALTLAASGVKHATGSATITATLGLTASGEAASGIGLPPRPRTRWQLVAGPAAGGHELALTEATARRYVAKLTEPSELSFTLDGRRPQALAIDELATDMHLLWTSDDGDTRILDRLRVGATQDTITQDAHQTQVGCLDYKAVLARRRLFAGDTLTYTGVDQAEIAWGLVSSTQGNTGGGLGISKGWTGTAPTGVTRDRTYELGDSVGERIQELSEVIGGFDWDIEPTSASALQLRVWYPQRGTDRSVVLLEGGLAATVQRNVDPGAYANALRYTGADGLSAQELAAADLAAAAQGRWDAAFGDAGLTTQAALNERAAWQLEQSQVVPVTYTVTLRRGGWNGPDHIWLGDPVRLIVKSGRLAVDTTLRVFEVGIDLDGDGGEQVTLTLGGRRPDYRRRPRRIEQRLNNLERR